MRLNSAKDMGSLVRQARRDRGWTQVQLAERAGVSRDWIIRLEQGRGSVELGLALRTLKALKLVILAQPIPSSATSDCEFEIGDVLGEETTD